MKGIHGTAGYGAAGFVAVLALVLILMPYISISHSSGASELASSGTVQYNPPSIIVRNTSEIVPVSMITQLVDISGTGVNAYRMWNGYDYMQLHTGGDGRNRYFEANFTRQLISQENIFLQYASGPSTWSSYGSYDRTTTLQLANNTGWEVIKTYTRGTHDLYNVTYLLENNKPLKIKITVFSDAANTYRIDWYMDGINDTRFFPYNNTLYIGQSMQNYSIKMSYDDVRSRFGVNFTSWDYSLISGQSRINVYLGNFSLNASQRLDLDPSVQLQRLSDTQMSIDIGQSQNITVSLTQRWPFTQSNISILQLSSGVYKFSYNFDMRGINLSAFNTSTAEIMVNSPFPLTTECRQKTVHDDIITNSTCISWYDPDMNSTRTQCHNDTQTIIYNITACSPELLYNDLRLSFYDIATAYPVNITQMNDSTYNISVLLKRTDITPDGFITLDPASYSNGAITITGGVMNLTQVNAAINNPAVMSCNGPGGQNCTIMANLTINPEAWLNVSKNAVLNWNNTISGVYILTNNGNLTIFNATMRAVDNRFRWSIDSTPAGTGQLVIINSSISDIGWFNVLEQEVGFYTGIPSYITGTRFTNVSAMYLDSSTNTFSNNSVTGNQALDAPPQTSEYSGLSIGGFSAYANFNNVTFNIIDKFQSCQGGCTDLGITIFGTNNLVVSNNMTNIGGEDSDGGAKFENSRPLWVSTLNNGLDVINNDIENNTITNCDSHPNAATSANIYVESDNNIFRYNNANTDVLAGNCLGIWVAGGDNNIFENNNISEIWGTVKISTGGVQNNGANYNIFNFTLASQSNTYSGIYPAFQIDRSMGNIVSNSNITDSTTGISVDLTSAYDNTFIANLINASSRTSTSHIGVRIRNSNGIQQSGNNFTNNSIFGKVAGVEFITNATLNVFNDNTIDSGSAAKDMDVTTQICNGQNNYLINNTLANKEINFTADSGNCTVTTKWYLTVQVNGTAAGAPLDSPVVSAINLTQKVETSAVGNSTGWVVRLNLTDQIMNRTTNITLENYTINATKNFYTTDSKSVVMTKSKMLFMNVSAINQQPLITFIAPTENNNSMFSRNWTFVNVSTNINVSAAVLEFNGLNYSMANSTTGDDFWYYNITNLSSANYSYRVWANDTFNTTNVTLYRYIRLDTIPPQITQSITFPSSSQVNITWTWFDSVTENGSIDYGNIVFRDPGSNVIANISSLVNGSQLVNLTPSTQYTINLTTQDDLKNQNSTLISILTPATQQTSPSIQEVR